MLDFIVEDKEKIVVEWPGWSLSDNKYGAEFDKEARIRMVIGSRKLIPYILKYRHGLGDSLLEIGPFFNPLLRFSGLREFLAEDASVTFLENDPNAVAWLRRNHPCRILEIDMNSASFTDDLQTKLASETPGYANSFNTIIISQVLNYIDHSLLFRSLFQVLRPGGLLFINNVINYGIPPLFSPKRPRSNKEIIKTAMETGYTVLERNTIPKHFKNEPQRRLIVVLSTTPGM